MDAALLYVACRITKTPARWKRISLGATLGGVFALLFPLLVLPKPLSLLLLFAVGISTCLIAVTGRRKTGLYICSFFLSAFATAGLAYAFPCVSPPLASLSLALVFVVFSLLSRLLYRRRAMLNLVFDCVITRGGNTMRAQGFYDSGNRAERCGLPVCFISPELFFQITDGDIFIEADDRLIVSTLNGEKEYRLYRAELEITREKKDGVWKSLVYFAVSGRILSREYSIVLPACVFDGGG